MSSSEMTIKNLFTPKFLATFLTLPGSWVVGVADMRPLEVSFHVPPILEHFVTGGTRVFGLKTKIFLAHKEFHKHAYKIYVVNNCERKENSGD